MNFKYLNVLDGEIEFMVNFPLKFLNQLSKTTTSRHWSLDVYWFDRQTNAESFIYHSVYLNVYGISQKKTLLEKLILITNYQEQIS